MAAPVLEVKDLTVQYARDHHANPAVNGVNFAVDAGLTLGIIGESGSGKTTLALAVSGLIDSAVAHVSGQVFFKGRELLSLGEDELCKIRGAGIGMIFQDPVNSLDPSMPIIKQVAEPLNLHQEITRDATIARASQLLAEMGIGEETLSVAPYAHQLSGGLCQRAMIAVALACNPGLLIADEPTSALDTTTQAQILQLLKSRQAVDNLAVVFISHDLALVSNIADEIMVVHRGQAVEMGAAQEVLKRPAHPYTAQLISAWEETGAGGGAQVGAA